MESVVVILLIVILIAICVNLILTLRRSSSIDPALDFKISNISNELSKVESALKNEFSTNRLENSELAKNSRIEQLQSFRSFEATVNAFAASVDLKLKDLVTSLNQNSKDNRAELKQNLEAFKNDFSASIHEFNRHQKDNFFALLGKQDDQNRSTSENIEQMRKTLEHKLADLQQGNEKKLDEMRMTVDDKLQKTLETRLGASFKIVSERLEAVHKGLGDMQQLATGVGDLKKVLSNVKSRGIMGEYQLENLLEQTLTLEQYCKNAKTKVGSNAVVEFAVKLPGGDSKPVLLPIDSKFPKEDYELLIDAYDNDTAEQIDERRKAFARAIRKCAQDIYTKYIDPPNTTDFAILFLPFESLYAEVLRVPGLFDTLRMDYKVNIASPSTLGAFLSSLQMGFRTLAIEKRSSEVWQLLGAVKTEFSLFAGILDKTQKKLVEASNVIEQAGVRTRAIERKLKNVEELPSHSAIPLLNDGLEIPVFSQTNASNSLNA